MFKNRELEKCAAREVAMRKNVFRRRGMTPERTLEIAMMEAIRLHFQEIADAEETQGRAPDGQAFFNFSDGKSAYVPLYERKADE